jgi:hypothetical protein
MGAVQDPPPHTTFTKRTPPLGRPNYQHEKRQKDLAKKKKAEEKKLRKAEKKNQPEEGATPSSPGEGEGESSS